MSLSLVLSMCMCVCGLSPGVTLSISPSLSHTLAVYQLIITTRYLNRIHSSWSWFKPVVLKLFRPWPQKLSYLGGPTIFVWLDCTDRYCENSWSKSSRREAYSPLSCLIYDSLSSLVFKRYWKSLNYHFIKMSIPYTGCWIIGEKVRGENGRQANHLGTSQNYLGTPLGVTTPTLGTTALKNHVVNKSRLSSR